MTAEELKPFYVTEDSPPCPHCGEGQTWTIIGPDGVCLGETFAEEVDAEEMADTLNHAYELGQLTRATKEEV